MNTTNLQAKNASEVSSHEVSTSERSYHEISGLQPETRDVLKQLEANIRLLEDLGGRLNFMLTEVRTLLRR